MANPVRLQGANRANDGLHVTSRELTNAHALDVSVVDSEGNIANPKVTSATNTKVTVGSTSTSVLASNASRNEMILINDSDEEIYVSLSGTAVINEGIRLNSSGGSIVNTTYTGAVTAICASGSKNLTVVEE